MRGIVDRFLAEGQTAQVAGFAWFPLDNPGLVSIPLAFALGALSLGPWLESLLVLAGTIAGCLLLEALVRRAGPLRPLFGLPARHPPWARQAAAATIRS